MTNGNIKTLSWDVQENTLQITTIDGTVYTLTDPKLSDLPSEDDASSVLQIVNEYPRNGYGTMAHLMDEFYKGNAKTVTGGDLNKVVFAKHKKILTGDSVIMETATNTPDETLGDEISAVIPLYLSVTQP